MSDALRIVREQAPREYARLLGECARWRSRTISQRDPLWQYAIQAGEDGPIKLGVAANPVDRLSTLQQGNPIELRGIGAWRCLPEEERLLHARFASARIRGEWFRPVPELLRLVWLEGCEYEPWWPLTPELLALTEDPS